MLHQWKKEAKRKEKVDQWAIFLLDFILFSRFVIKRYGKLIDNEKKVSQLVVKVITRIAPSVEVIEAS